MAETELLSNVDLKYYGQLFQIPLIETCYQRIYLKLSLLK